MVKLTRRTYPQPSVVELKLIAYWNPQDLLSKQNNNIDDMTRLRPPMVRNILAILAKK